MKKSRFSRRDFLSLSATTAAGVVLTACAPAVAPSAAPEAMPEATAALAEEAAAVDDGGTMNHWC